MAADIVIIGIFLALARMSGPKQNVCCVITYVRVIFSYSSVPDMTNAITDILEVGLQ